MQAAEKSQKLEENRKRIIAELTARMKEARAGKTESASGSGELFALLWEALLLFQNYPFYTSQKLGFIYTIRGNEMFISRKGKSITRATVNVALKKALELQNAGVPISGPKKLGCFGASYLYPVFIHLGVISQKGEENADT